MKTRKPEEIIKDLFPEESVESVYIHNKDNAITIRFTNNALFNAARETLALHPVYAMGNNTLSLLIDPKLKAALENETKHNELKNSIDIAYRRIIETPEIKVTENKTVEPPKVIVTPLPPDPSAAIHFYEKGIDEENQSQLEQEKKQSHLEQAVSNYQKAADLGFIKAKTNLATFYLNGTGGLKQDKHKAFDLLSEAAKAGHARAQFNLAKMFEYGEGTVDNLVQARYWYAAAANQGDMAAKEAVAEISKKLSSHDAITSLFPEGVVYSTLDKTGTMTIRFTSDELFQTALEKFRDYLHSTNAMGNNTLSLSLTKALENEKQFKKIIDDTYAINIPTTKSQVEEQPPVAPHHGYIDRSKRFLDKENVQLIENSLDQGWKLSDTKIVPNNKEPYQTVLDKENNPKFNIHVNKLTTHKDNLDTFISMLKTYKAVHDNNDNMNLPHIITHNESAKELWKKAFNTIYKGQEVNLDELITIRTPKVEQPLIIENPPLTKSFK